MWVALERRMGERKGGEKWFGSEEGYRWEEEEAEGRGRGMTLLSGCRLELGES